jgi:hypothetical protein
MATGGGEKVYGSRPLLCLCECARVWNASLLSSQSIIVISLSPESYTTFDHTILAKVSRKRNAQSYHFVATFAWPTTLSPAGMFPDLAFAT